VVDWEGGYRLRLAFQARKEDVGGLEGHGPPSVSLFERGRGGGVLERGNPLCLAFRAREGDVGGLEEDIPSVSLFERRRGMWVG